MLTHEELMEKCQELRQAINEATGAMDANDGIYNPDLDAHEYHMRNLVDREESLLSEYLENRDSISDADATEIILMIANAYCVVGFAIGSLGTEKNTPDSLMTNSHQNKHE